MMRRRAFITLLGGAAAWPLTARAQQQDRIRRVGVLVNGVESDVESQALVAAFRRGLENLGWSAGRNIHLDTRFAADASRFQPLARDLVALRPEVILAHTTPFAAAAQLESHTIPIVFTSVSDPIGSGFIASLSRPGSNLTGLLLYEDGITGKWLAMLKEIAPQLRRAAIIANPKNTPYEYFLRSAQAPASALAIELVPSPVENAVDIQQTIASFARVPDGGLVFLPDALILANRDLVIALAAHHRVPTVYSIRTFVTAGGLMSYDTDRADQFRQAATYVDHILRGEKPADLPVRAPTKYETVLNLKTAKALRLDVPAGLLVAADEVIE
jgi:putative ABC transport system substrate-binding protein